MVVRLMHRDNATNLKQLYERKFIITATHTEGLIKLTEMNDK